eukprot:762082-Hanusia_phi.AAC.3
MMHDAKDHTLLLLAISSQLQDGDRWEDGTAIALENVAVRVHHELAHDDDLADLPCFQIDH